MSTFILVCFKTCEQRQVVRDGVKKNYCFYDMKIYVCPEMVYKGFTGTGNACWFIYCYVINRFCWNCVSMCASFELATLFAMKFCVADLSDKVKHLISVFSFMYLFNYCNRSAKNQKPETSLL